MLNVPKHGSNLHHVTFIIFINHCQVSSVGKRLSYWHAKSWDCLLTHWLPMKSILFLIETIQRYQLRCNCLRNKKLFRSVLLHFWNVDYILNSLKQKVTLRSFVFPKLPTLKTELCKCLKSLVSDDPSTSNMVNVSKHCSSLHRITFIIFNGHFQVNWLGKSPSYWHEKS